MKVNAGWIREYLCRTMLSDGEAAEALEKAGMEIEQISSSPQIDKRVVVALVKKVVQHPGADRLHLVDVDDGEGSVRVVCGAPNVREGLLVALARVGAELPSGDRIGKAKLRGESSDGMLCSEHELGLGKDHNGILELSSDVVPGTSLCDVYPSDTIIDLKTPANRFDVLSVVGLAREVSAMTDNLFQLPTPPPVPISPASKLIADATQAQRYMLARVRVDQSTPSPLQVVARLRAAGMRSLGSVVDVTNYAMLEFGQPMHAFDAAKVSLPVSVRSARNGEKLITLDGVERKLSKDDLIIADTSGPIALAGLMGGAATEVTSVTTEILLESAVFDGVRVRKMAKRHNLRTEASARFERGLPLPLPALALARACELLGKMAGGRVLEAADQQNGKPTAQHIEVHIPRLARLLGFGISHKEAIAALNKLGIEAEKPDIVGELHKQAGKPLNNGAKFQTGVSDYICISEVPWWRPDVKSFEDLAEEIVRVVGYDKVPSTIPSWRPKRLEFDRARSVKRRVRDLMYGAGLFEVMTYSFVSEEQLSRLGFVADSHLKLRNPLSSEQAYLRSSLLASHVSVLTRNRQYAKEFGFYEVSNVFVKGASGDQPEEPLRLGVMVRRGEGSYAAAKGILDALAAEVGAPLSVSAHSVAAFAPGRAGIIKRSRQHLGWIGQLHPALLRELKVEGEAAYFEIELGALLETVDNRRFTGVNKYPTIARDITVLVPRKVSWARVEAALSEYDATFVGDYYGEELPEGTKGLTLRLVLTNPDRTPNEAEAAELEKIVMKRLEREFGAKIRA